MRRILPILFIPLALAATVAVSCTDDFRDVLPFRSVPDGPPQELPDLTAQPDTRPIVDMLPAPADGGADQGMQG